MLPWAMFEGPVYGPDLVSDWKISGNMWADHRGSLQCMKDPYANNSSDWRSLIWLECHVVLNGVVPPITSAKHGAVAKRVDM